MALAFCLALRCQFGCGQTGGCRRVDARFALAAWTLAFGPPASRRRSRRTPVTLGIGLYRHSSRWARDGARNQFINRAVKRLRKVLVPSWEKGLAKIDRRTDRLVYDLSVQRCCHIRYRENPGCRYTHPGYACCSGDLNTPSLPMNRAAGYFCSQPLIIGREKGVLVAGAATGDAITAWALFSAIGGSLIGAVIGGSVSYFLQRKALNTAKTQRDEDRFERRKALGFSLFYKLIRISSELNNSAVAIQGSIEAGRKAGLTELFQVVQPPVPIADKVEFSSEEMALLLSVDAKLFNAVAALDNLHNSTVALFELYLTRRTSVLERFGATMSGSIGTTGLTETEKNWLAPRAVELNGLAAAMLQQAKDGAIRTWRATELLHAMLERDFGLKQKLERDPDVPAAS